jgi:hypothetical protein
MITQIRKNGTGTKKVKTGDGKKASGKKVKPEDRDEPSFSADGIEVVEDFADRLEILKEAVHTQVVVTLWIPLHRVRVNARVEHFNNSGDTVTVRLDKSTSKEDLPNFQKEFEQSGKCAFANCNLGTGAIFFSVRSVSSLKSKTVLQLELGRVLYRLQRRGTFRMRVEKDTKMYVQVNGKIKEIADISAGGLGLLGQSDEAALFSPEKKLDSISFFVNKRRIKCGAEVCWAKVKSSEGESKLFAGLKFTNLSPKDRHYIDFFVMDKCYGYIQFINSIRQLAGSHAGL